MYSNKGPIVSEIEKIYVAGFKVKAPRFEGDLIHGDYSTELSAKMSFSGLLAGLFEEIRDEVREEEMEIAQRDNESLLEEQRILKDKMDSIKSNYKEQVLSALLSKIESSKIEEPAADDVETWAFNDGVNHLADELKRYVEKIL